MGKKKSGKDTGKGKKGKKAGDDNMSSREAALAYQILNREKAMDDLRFEMETLKEKIERGTERNLKLKEEQEGHMQQLVSEMKEEENNEKRDPLQGRAQIEAALHDLWLTDQQQSQQVQELKRQIDELDGLIADEQTTLQRWEDYKEYGQHEDGRYIRLLEDELHDNQATFDEMADFLAYTLAKTKTEIDSYTEETVETVKSGAADVAIGNLDKKDSREIKDHGWLAQEAVRYREEVARIDAEVTEIEQDNLKLMAHLFDCKVDDLRISRKFFLTQMDNESVFNMTGREGIVEADLLSGNLPLLYMTKAEVESLRGASGQATPAPPEEQPLVAVPPKQDQISETTSGYSSFRPLELSDSARSDERVVRERPKAGAGVRPGANARPKSATLKAIEERVFGSESEGDFDEGFGSSDEEWNTRMAAGNGLAENALDNYFNYEDESQDEYLKLGPLELKMLQVSGQKMQVRVQTPLTSEELELRKYKPDKWPVTSAMLNSFIRNPPPPAETLREEPPRVDSSKGRRSPHDAGTSFTGSYAKPDRTAAAAGGLSTTRSSIQATSRGQLDSGRPSDKRSFAVDSLDNPTVPAIPEL